MNIQDLNLIAWIIGPLVALGFFLLGLTARRPKLRSGGGGSGSIRPGGLDVMASHITVRNEPTIFGMRIRREPAQIDSARVYDPALKEYVGPALHWRTEGNQLARRFTIDPGKQGQLYVFAKERYSENYFVFSSTALDAPLPEHRVSYSDSMKDFAIVVFDELGRQHRFSVVARNSAQSVSIQHKLTFHGRIRMVKEALSLLRRAVSPG